MTSCASVNNKIIREEIAQFHDPVFITLSESSEQ